MDLGIGWCLVGIGFENSPQLAGKLEIGSRSKPIIPAKTILLILGMCDARVFFLGCWPQPNVKTTWWPPWLDDLQPECDEYVTSHAIQPAAIRTCLKTHDIGTLSKIVIYMEITRAWGVPLSILYYIILHYIILYYIILLILYNIILYYIILYYIRLD